MKILLIDDDPGISVMYKTAFKLKNIDVIAAQNGNDGLWEAHNKPALILLDIMMPNTDGFEVLRQLKKDNETKDIPVFMLTNLNSDVDVQKAKQYGAMDYLIKSDYTPSQVIDKVMEYLQR